MFGFDQFYQSLESQVFNIFAERPDEEIKPDSWSLVLQGCLLVQAMGKDDQMPVMRPGGVLGLTRLTRLPFASLKMAGLWRCFVWRAGDSQNSPKSSAQGIRIGFGNWRRLPSTMATLGTGSRLKWTWNQGFGRWLRTSLSCSSMGSILKRRRRVRHLQSHRS